MPIPWAGVEHSPTDPHRQGPGQERHLMFAQHCSCSIYMLNALLSSFTDEDVLLQYSQEIDKLIYNERIS